MDELITALQQLSQDGYGAAAVHALTGDTTSPVRGAEKVTSWGFAAGHVALLNVDPDDEEAGQPLRAQGSSMTGEPGMRDEPSCRLRMWVWAG